MSRPKFSHLHVYVAGPMTIGDQMVNTKRGINTSEALMRLGFVVYCPHLSAFHHMIHERDWETWLQFDERWLERCDALYRIPGESKGADREVAWCKNNDTPVFYGVGDLVEWAEEDNGWRCGYLLSDEIFDLLEAS